MNDISALNGKRILLGVTGSIAAYKAADLVRRLQDCGAQVRVMMTEGACQFITPLTLQTLSGFPVAINLLDAVEESTMGHIALARWADWILVAPASADTLARLVQGRADDILTATILASEAPLAIAPAMNNKMWSNTVTQTNLEVLKQRGVVVLGPDSGDQACGEVGEGRLLEPQMIISELARYLVPARLQGKHIVITAGPTHEPIDPVRFIGNRSSGKMGFALAQACVEAGAEVTLISGPVNLSTPTKVKRINVQTALEMHEHSLRIAAGSDIFIGCAAVADYRVATPASQKMKKNLDENLHLQLVANADIISEIAAMLARPNMVVGFAAETQSVADYAQQKRVAKKLDMIAANSVADGQVFGADTNALQVFWQGGEKILPVGPKAQLARDLVTLIIEHYYAKNTVKTA
ncbi:bifunctional phosphopantothenoylcysteine decarboxylase/phosphopantothenate--cysteine ligase CoaBC [Methylophaga sp. OBS3]|uniref:bifunctional phosphopantothenoylcysteine decarboxylase/phosphopantothenate--cysteine ligase CoaBC n=1 Tax=Methylophaga sp. OBS3 TaxID=2991934 RepID=UPI002257434F|nr:bifunctional phosphopantothenoylcysteine decarboxylase/phosphopantothenate--cysteine ligase CoaBC [Methylophaga sp. OBS3]MCX4190716.1 bifunctional phosphopantothenoylcysteine decarboxylase/phosphopantothenate--cysteine ligase CoaBC [Methylophaga sp. OBS3]